MVGRGEQEGQKGDGREVARDEVGLQLDMGLDVTPMHGDHARLAST